MPPARSWPWIRVAFINHSLGTRPVFFTARRNIPPFARSAFLDGFRGLLFCLRNQFLRLFDGFVFLRIREASDFSSFTCVWHSLTMAECGDPGCSVLYNSDENLFIRV
jgi:hypothetical protein